MNTNDPEIEKMIEDIKDEAGIKAGVSATVEKSGFTWEFTESKQLVFKHGTGTWYFAPAEFVLFLGMLEKQKLKITDEIKKLYDQERQQLSEQMGEMKRRLEEIGGDRE